MPARNLITLTTDFGVSDWFVGTMKGVILGINRRAEIVDITHAVGPGDIRAGAFALAAGCRYFPKGTIHVAVVDPGVGSARDAIVVRTKAHYFIGPDNGVLSWAAREDEVEAIYRLENENLFLKPTSRTFHGRDVFAPVAAHLSRGKPLRSFGSRATTLVRLEWPEPRRKGSQVEGEVIYIDRFGNGITNLPAKPGLRLSGATCEIRVRRRLRCRVEPCYAAVPQRGLVAVPGSSGFMEIAVNGGSARDVLGLKAGTRVLLRLSA